MKPRTWRPERRNRNIGTAKSGHGQSNKMVVPASRLDRFGIDTWYGQRLGPASAEKHMIKDNEVTVLYEPPRRGFTYGCSPKDVIHLLSRVPGDACDLLELIVFRQPTRNQMQLNPVWGRMLYSAVIGNHIGAAIYLEAQEIGVGHRWSRKLSLHDQEELQRLREDGHAIEETKRDYIVTPNQESIRNTQLYGTLLHELGHWVQYSKDFLDDDTALSDDPDVAYDLYFAKPTS